MSLNDPELPLTATHRARLYKLWAASGIFFILLQSNLLIFSRWYAHGDISAAVQIQLICWHMVGGALLLWMIHRAKSTPDSPRLFAWIVGAGVVMRLILVTSEPVLESDAYRYLWEGGMAANGCSPYKYAPKDALAARDALRNNPSLDKNQDYITITSSGDIPGQGEKQRKVPRRLAELAEESGAVIEKVNHPDLSTVYPPVSQAAFAAAHFMAPWSLAAWRVENMLLDVVVLVLLVLILRQLKMPSIWVVVYWWNPVVMKEIFNSGHNDLVALPFLLGAVYLTLRRRHGTAMVPLALAVGAKLWPLILLPLFLRPMWKDWKRLAAAGVVFAVLVGAILLPVMLTDVESDRSGFAQYGKKWEMNDGLYMITHAVADVLVNKLGLGRLIFSEETSHFLRAHAAARFITAGLLGVLVLLLARQPFGTGRDFTFRCMLVVGALFMLSPTQFPWYYLWVLPFLVFHRHSWLLVLTALLPIYNLRFLFDGIQPFVFLGYIIDKPVDIYHYLVVWVQYLPVLLLLLLEWRRYRRRSQVTSLESSVSDET